MAFLATNSSHPSFECCEDHGATSDPSIYLSADFAPEKLGGPPDVYSSELGLGVTLRKPSLIPETGPAQISAASCMKCSDFCHCWFRRLRRSLLVVALLRLVRRTPCVERGSARTENVFQAEACHERLKLCALINTESWKLQ